MQLPGISGSLHQHFSMLCLLPVVYGPPYSPKSHVVERNEYQYDTH